MSFLQTGVVACVIFEFIPFASRRLAWLCLLVFGLLCSNCAAADLEKFTFEKPQMGVPFRITLYAVDAKVAAEAAAAAFSRVEALNQVLSDYEDDSELVQLSKSSGSGRKARVSDDLWKVLFRARALAEETQGAFDVTCGPIVNIWRRARRKGELPDPGLVEEMRVRTGWQKMLLHQETQEVELTAADMRLDLGAIAKGYACDEALKILKQRGISSALVAASGDIVVGDPPPGKKGWRLEVSKPEDAPADAGPVFVELANMALTTSGDQFQKLEINGKRYSHILDLRTGQPLTDHSMVSVIAPDGLTADSLATACSILGSKEGAALIQKTPGASARFYRQAENGSETAVTPEWKSHLVTD